MEAGGDIDVHLAAKGYVFELEARNNEYGYRHVYLSKLVPISCHSPAPSNALDLTISFTRVRILDKTGNVVQKHSSEYRRIAKHQASELALLAEVVGWAQNAGASPTDQYAIASRFGRPAFACDVPDLANIKTHMWSTCVRSLRIFAPYWLVNRQPEALCVSYCHRALQFMGPCEWRLLGVPFQGKASLALGVSPESDASRLPPLPRDAGSNATGGKEIYCGRPRSLATKLCPAFRVDIVGRSTTVSVPTPNMWETAAKRKDKKLHTFGVTVALAPPPFSRSKVISIYSRFVLQNNLPWDIWVKESFGSALPLQLKAGSQSTLHPQTMGNRGDAFICITTTDPAIVAALVETSESGERDSIAADSYKAVGKKGRYLERNIWSPHLLVARDSQLQIRLKSLIQDPKRLCRGTGMNGEHRDIRRQGRALLWSYQNIQITVRLVDGASFILEFCEPVVTEYLIVNNTDRLVAFAQSGIRDKSVWELLGGGQQIDYCWTDPQKEKKHLRFSFWDKTQQVIKTCDIARVRVHRALLLPKSRETIHFITDVCGSRRRVTLTTSAPFATGENISGECRTLKNVSHEIFRSHRKRHAKAVRRDKSPGVRLSSTPHSPFTESLGIKNRLREGSAQKDLVAPFQTSSLYFRVHKRKSQGARPSFPGSSLRSGSQRAKTTVGLGPLDSLGNRQQASLTRKVLRFQQWEPMFSEIKETDQRAVGESALRATATEKEAFVDGFRGTKGSFNVSKGVRRTEENGFPRMQSTADFLSNYDYTLRRSRTLGLLAARASLASMTFGRQGYGLPHRRTSTLSSSELVQASKPSERSCISEVGYYFALSIRGVGISLVDATPQELVFLGCSGIRSTVRRLHGAAMQDYRFSINAFQIDNGINGAQHQTILRHATLEERIEHHAGDGRQVLSEDETKKLRASEGAVKPVVRSRISWDVTDSRGGESSNLFFRCQLGGSWLQEATLLEYVDVELSPIALHVEADTALVLLRFFVQLLRNRNLFFRSLQDRNVQLVRQAASSDQDSSGYQQLRAFPKATAPVPASLRPLYIGTMCFRPTLIILTSRSQRLQRRHITTEHDELVALRHFGALGDRITDITNFPLKSRAFTHQCLFTTSEQLISDLSSSYIQQCIRQLHKLVASIDVIGNPLRLITGVSSGLRTLTVQPFKGKLPGFSMAGLRPWNRQLLVQSLLHDKEGRRAASIADLPWKVA